MHFDPASPPVVPGSPPFAECVLSISELNRLARQTLEARFPPLAVVGELSNLTRAPSGHYYFTLKDAQAQVRCTMWRSKAALLGFRPENGMQVEARAVVTLYEARGDFQLSIEALAQAGRGSLFEAFTRLKEKLAAEGLFDAAMKRGVPRFPRRVGVVTSPSAAAYQDVLATLRRRAPHLQVVLYPAMVQGAESGHSLTEAVGAASQRAEADGIDVVLLVRGGGSLEDLWGFNNEALVRAVRRCPVPVISGIGHETDFTIADFAADVRATTPTGAAELATAGYHEAAARLGVLGRSLSRAFDARLNALAQRLDRAALRLVHPRERLRQSSTGIERLEQRLTAAMKRRLDDSIGATRLLSVRLHSARPDLRRGSERCATAAQRLHLAGESLLRARSRQLAALAAHLEHLGPQGVLARGYSIVRDGDGHIVRRADQVDRGSPLSIRLSAGRLDATVTGRHVGDPDSGIVTHDQSRLE